jgi:hypothetical protein
LPFLRWKFIPTIYCGGKLAMMRLKDVLREGWTDKLSGGKADDKKPQDFDQKALMKGIHVELEHTGDIMLAMEIAMDHLTEDPQYYEKLTKAGL